MDRGPGRGGPARELAGARRRRAAPPHRDASTPRRTRTTGCWRSSTSHRHFFIRQEAAKRVKDRRRLFAFEDDRHVGQILVRHLTRREDVTYLERHLDAEPPRRGALGGAGPARARLAAGSRSPSRGTRVRSEAVASRAGAATRAPTAAADARIRASPWSPSAADQRTARGRPGRRKPPRVGRPLRRRAGVDAPRHRPPRASCCSRPDGDLARASRPVARCSSRSRGRPRGRQPRVTARDCRATP